MRLSTDILKSLSNNRAPAGQGGRSQLDLGDEDELPRLRLPGQKEMDCSYDRDYLSWRRRQTGGPVRASGHVEGARSIPGQGESRAQPQHQPGQKCSRNPCLGCRAPRSLNGATPSCYSHPPPPTKLSPLLRQSEQDPDVLIPCLCTKAAREQICDTHRRSAWTRAACQVRA